MTESDQPHTPRRPEDETPFVDRLGAHLARAAAEQWAEHTGEPVRDQPDVPDLPVVPDVTELTPRRWQRRARAAVMAAAACAVVAIGLTIIVSTDQDTVDAIDVERMDDGVIVTVKDVVTDPADVERELRDNGVEVSLIGVPVPPYLVGQIVAERTGEEGLVSYTRNDRNVIVGMEIRSSLGPIELLYGRVAEPGERYLASDAPPECAAWRNQPVAAVGDQIADLFPVIRWQEFSADGTVRNLDAPAPDDLVMFVVPISAEETMAVVAKEPNTISQAGNCA